MSNNRFVHFLIERIDAKLDEITNESSNPEMVEKLVDEINIHIDELRSALEIVSDTESPKPQVKRAGRRPRKQSESPEPISTGISVKLDD